MSLKLMPQFICIRCFSKTGTSRKKILKHYDKRKQEHAVFCSSAQCYAKTQFTTEDYIIMFSCSFVVWHSTVSGFTPQLHNEILARGMPVNCQDLNPALRLFFLIPLSNFIYPRFQGISSFWGFNRFLLGKEGSWIGRTTTYLRHSGSLCYRNNSFVEIAVSSVAENRL